MIDNWLTIEGVLQLAGVRGWKGSNIVGQIIHTIRSVDVQNVRSRLSHLGVPGHIVDTITIHSASTTA